MKNHDMISDIFYQAVQEPKAKDRNNLYKESRIKSHEIVMEMENLLNAEGKALFEKLLDKWMEVEVAGTEESFVLGFRLGARLMAEVLEKDINLS